ncbi:MAG: cytochrome c biogenesis protein ResB [bacterium]
MILRVLKLLGSLRVTVIGLIFLLILTVWGTLYQADYGLYGAQERFYQSWFFMVGGILPFPGAQMVMSVLFINLVSSMLLRALRGRLKWGLVITHLGLMLMLAAGAVTFYLGKESHLSLVEGEGSNVAMSYNEWELAMLPSSEGKGREVSSLDAKWLRPGKTISFPDGRLALRVDEFYRNCEATRDRVEHAPESGSGYTTLTPRPRNREPAEDLPGLVFTLVDGGKEKGRHLVWGGDPAPTMLSVDGQDRPMSLRRQRMPLPTVIQLIDFRRELHPGSGIAKSYSSQVVVKSGEGLERQMLISMNKPLRLRGFTFYQSSFSSGPGGREISTLSVVRNYGRLMPYIATGATVTGMLLHFIGMLIHRLSRRRPQEVPA